MEKVVATYGDYDEDSHSPDEPPAEIIPRDDGFLISFGSLDIRYRYGEYYDMAFGPAALENALSAMREAFPGIAYEGCMECVLSDAKSGEAYHCDLSTEYVSLYDFIGEALGNILATDADEIYPPRDYFWETFESELSCNEDYEETVRVLYAYAAWIGEEALEAAVDKILAIAEDSDYDDIELLEELLGELREGEEE